MYVKKVAERLVTEGGGSASVLIKMFLTPEQLGADISFLSCFPGEVEHLFGPGVYIEPKPERGGARMPGAVKTVESQIHVKKHDLIKKMMDADEASFAAADGAPPAKPAALKPSKTQKLPEAALPKEDKE